MSSYWILIIPIVAGSVAQLLFKKGILTMGSFNIPLSLTGIFSFISKILQNGWLLAGMFVFGISFLAYLSILPRFQLNVIYPIFVSTGVIIISLTSWFLFKETLNLLQILGIIAIIFGIFLLANNGHN